MTRSAQSELDCDAIKYGLLKGLALSASLATLLTWWTS